MSRIRSKLGKAVGYLWRRYAPCEAALPDASAEELRIVNGVRPFTMTSPERIYGLISAIRYVAANRIPGDIVECGVWRGGSMMAAAKTLLALNSTERHLYLFDTFGGMTAPSAKDGTRFGSATPAETFARMQNADGTNQWCFASLDDVRGN